MIVKNEILYIFFEYSYGKIISEMVSYLYNVIYLLLYKYIIFIYLSIYVLCIAYHVNIWHEFLSLLSGIKLQMFSNHSVITD